MGGREEVTYFSVLKDQFMNKNHVHALLLVVILAIFSIVTGCTNTMVAERTSVDGTGVLNLPDMFGSSLRITGDDGLIYIPSPFPHDPFKNGDKVAFSGRTIPNPYYPIQSGVPVDLVLMRQIPGDSGYIYGIGNVTYITTEGGFYGIVVDTGGKSGVVRYLPLDLDPEFSQDGIRVSFTAYGRPDVITISQWGLPINIVRMKKLT
jgi:hypothetical protein